MRCIVWYIVFFLFLILILPLYFVIWLMEVCGARRTHDRMVRWLVHLWSGMLLGLAGVRLEVEGQENLTDEPAVIVGNHQGDFDIPVLLRILNWPPSMISKKEVRHIPLLGMWMRRLHCVFIDRSNPQSAIEKINTECDKLIKARYSVQMFPEGTRSRGGEIKRFKKGAFKVAEHTGAPILPIVMEGSYKALEANNFWIKPCTVYVRVLPRIPVQGLSREELDALPETVRELVVATHAQLLQRAARDQSQKDATLGTAEA